MSTILSVFLQSIGVNTGLDTQRNFCKRFNIRIEKEEPYGKSALLLVNEQDIEKFKVDLAEKRIAKTVRGYKYCVEIAPEEVRISNIEDKLSLLELEVRVLNQAMDKILVGLGEK